MAHSEHRFKTKRGSAVNKKKVLVYVGGKEKEITFATHLKATKALYFKG